MSLLCFAILLESQAYKIGYALGSFLGRYGLMLLIGIILIVAYLVFRKRKKIQ